MKQSYLKDQRGVAMLFELLLVVAVLAIAGLAVHQAASQAKTASQSTKVAQPASANGLAVSAAAIAEQESASDASISSGTEASIGELDATGDDITNLEGSFNEANF